MVLPLSAAMVFSTKPPSFSVSVWMRTWTSISSADGKAAIDGGRRGTPILMQLETAHAGLDLLDQPGRQAGAAFPKEAEIDREGICSLKHPLDMPRPGRAGRGRRPRRRAGPAAQQRGQARIQRLFDLLRADKMNMHIDAAGRYDLALAGDDFRCPAR